MTGSGSLSEGAVATATEGVAPSGRELTAKPSEGERAKNKIRNELEIAQAPSVNCVDTSLPEGGGVRTIINDNFQLTTKSLQV